MQKPKIKNRLELAKYFAEMGFNYGAEVGVYDGRYSEILFKANPNLKMLCIDIWKKERIHNAAIEKLKPYKATLIKKSSVEVAKEIPDGSLDFVFIDADHHYEFVKEDINAWAPKVRSGGIVSGHDYYVFYHSKNTGVIDAVNEYVKENNIELQLTEEDPTTPCRDDVHPCWYFIKE